MQALVEFEVGVDSRLFNCPAGEAARHFGDVFLRVAAVHAERVQLHQFAPVIFVQAALIFLRALLRIHRRARRPAPAEGAVTRLLAHRALHGLALRGARIGAQKIVEVKKHCGTFRCRGD